MTDELPIMIAAVVVAVGVMLLAADPLANFIAKNPTVVMLALGFLLMIGLVLIADGFGVHVPKGYVYTAMAFSAGVETLNIWSRARARASGGRSATTRTPAIERSAADEARRKDDDRSSARGRHSRRPVRARRRDRRRYRDDGADHAARPAVPGATCPTAGPTSIWCAFRPAATMPRPI